MERERKMKEREVRLKEQQVNRIEQTKKNREKIEQARLERQEKNERNITRISQEKEARASGSARASNNEVNNIINELMNAKLIDNREDLSFTLNSKSLTVNGKQQPDDVFQRFREKYIRKPGDLINYTKKENSTHITINRD